MGMDFNRPQWQTPLQMSPNGTKQMASMRLAPVSPAWEAPSSKPDPVFSGSSIIKQSCLVSPRTLLLLRYLTSWHRSSVNDREAIRPLDAESIYSTTRHPSSDITLNKVQTKLQRKHLTNHPLHTLFAETRISIPPILRWQPQVQMTQES